MNIRKFLRERYIIISTYRFLLCILKGFSLKTFFLCEIPIEQIPKSTNFQHPYAIVIRNGTIIGENCRIYQCVSIGSRHSRTTDHNNDKVMIGDNVVIGAGALILGNIKIGNNVNIGAGAIILKDVSAGQTAIGVWK